MINRAALARNGQQALRCACNAQFRRQMATAASGTFNYEVGETAGVRLASRDLPGPTTQLAIVAKAGTRYQLLPGFSEGLEKFAFKNTTRRSSLRINRETELLGGELFSYHSRENLVLGAKFLREDLPYFAELIGEVLKDTRFTSHELDEEVNHIIDMSRKRILADTSEFAMSSVHGVAFHRGLGNPLHPTSANPTKKYLSPANLLTYSQIAYAKPNYVVVANGAPYDEVKKWVGEFFADTLEKPPSDTEDIPVPGTSPSKYYGGEERVQHAGGNAMVIGFPGSSSFTGKSYKPEIGVLAALLGGQSNIKWSPGFSLLSRATGAFPQVHVETVHHTYSDAGLLTVSLSGNAHQVRDASVEVVKALKEVSAGKINAEDIQKAKATAKFRVLQSGQNISTGIESTGAGLLQGGKPYQLDELAQSVENVTDAQVKAAAKELLDGRASIACVGDLFVLPYAEEIDLRVY